MTMAQRNIICGAGLLVFCIAYGWLTMSLPGREAMPNTPGPAFFPWLIVTLVAGLSAAMLFQGLAAIRDGAQFGFGGKDDIDRAPIILLVSFLAYIVALPYLGFVAPGIVFFAVMMWLFGNRNPLWLSAFSVLAPVSLYVIFKIILPRGPWGF